MLEGISNHYFLGMERPKLETELHLVFQPTEAWNYAHHPFLTRFRGRFFLCFSSGVCHEDDVGQRIMFTGSDDFVHWDEPQILAQPDNVENGVLIPSGFYVNGDELTVYYLKFSYRPEVLKQGRRQMGSAGRVWHGTWYKTSADGQSWSDESPLPCFGGNMPVRRLQSGRLFSCGGRYQCYSDEQDGIHGWQQVEVFPRDMAIARRMCGKRMTCPDWLATRTCRCAKVPSFSKIAAECGCICVPPPRGYGLAIAMTKEKAGPCLSKRLLQITGPNSLWTGCRMADIITLAHRTRFLPEHVMCWHFHFQRMDWIGHSIICWLMRNTRVDILA